MRSAAAALMAGLTLPGRAAFAWGGSGAVPAPPAPAAAPAPAAPAPAPDVEGPMRPEAAALYKRGLERFGGRDYAGAVADLEAGYAIESRREFLFAEGQAKRLAGDCKGAVTLYQRFLATNPSPVQANATQIALGRCAQHLAEHPQVVVVERPRPPPPPPPPPPKWWRDPYGLAFTGAGAVGIATGIGFIAASVSARHDAENARTYPEADPFWSTAESRRQVGIGTLALGTVLTAVGVTRFVLVRRHARDGAADRRVDRTGHAAARRNVLRIVASVAIAGVLAASCIGPGDFHCTEYTQCTIGGQRGFCEANGRCSVVDDSCTTSGRRYAHRAGGDADECVPVSCEAHPIAPVTDDGGPAVRAGGGHACLVRDGGLWCWGRNDHGQVGDGSRTPRALPVRVPIAGTVTAVATGDAHTCAATMGGPVFCWGLDDAGQLGDLGGDEQGFPRQVPGVTNATALAAGKDFSCAVDADTRTVRCWGDDSNGQLGDGVAGPRRGPTAVAGLADVQALAAAWQHACARRGATTNDSSLVCWGANDQAQIGDGPASGPRGLTDLTMLPSAGASLPKPVTAVATGRGHTCAIASGGLYCWGANAQGQVSGELPNMPVEGPHLLGAMDFRDPISVAAGAEHTCLVHENGEVNCWGANASHQLELGTPPISNAAAVIAGDDFSCALARDHALYCWGDNHFGQLAIGGGTIRSTPVQVPGIAHAGALAAGGAHTCATADDASGARALFCWGANGSSQLGNGSSTDAPVATRISSLAPEGIAAGAAHTCAFPASHQLYCWGSGSSRQLGFDPGGDGVATIPTMNDLSPPDGGDGVFAVAAGAWHTCVGATISASVLCFGLDTDGQIGNPPLLPPAPAKVKALTAGDAHSCALDSTGKVWCWGRGDQGQLGDGRGLGRAVPMTVTLGTAADPATAIAAGGEHTCAIAGSRILCWGRNAEGQVGTPSQYPIPSPTEVMGLSNPAAIAAGGRHTCAIAADATVRCWGANESGQLGSGDTDSRNAPVPVEGLTDVEAVVAGGSHSCARRGDGTVWCWGANTSGQLGDGITLTSDRALLARIACE